MSRTRSTASLLLLCFGSRSRRRLFLLRFPALIVLDSGTDEFFQGRPVHLVALEKIDRPSLVAFEARIEQLVGIRDVRALVKGQLHPLLVGVADRDDAAAPPPRAPLPLPSLVVLAVGLGDVLADADNRLPPPVREFC